jgi:hypothetical protein
MNMLFEKTFHLYSQKRTQLLRRVKELKTQDLSLFTININIKETIKYIHKKDIYYNS